MTPDHVVEVFVEESSTNPSTGVGQKGVDRLPTGCCIELFHPLNGGEICLERFHHTAKVAEVPCCDLDLRLVRRNDQIEAIFSATARQFIADAC